MKLLTALDKTILAFTREVTRLGDKNYVAAWFSWLEWTLVAGVLVGVGDKTGSLILRSLGYASGALVVFVAIVAIDRVRDEYIRTTAGRGLPASGIALVVTVFSLAAVHVTATAVVGLISSACGT